MTAQTTSWDRGRWGWSPLLLPHRCPSYTATMVFSASFGNSGQLSEDCAVSEHIKHVEAPRDGSVVNVDGVADLVNEDVGASIASTGGDFDLWQDERISYVVYPASTTFVLLLCRRLLPNCFAVAFRFPECGGFVLSLRIAYSDCALKAISLRSTCGFEAQCSRRL